MTTKDIKSALQNVVRTFRSAVSGRPEGLHNICFFNALVGESNTRCPGSMRRTAA